MLWRDTKQLFKERLSFRLACSYLAILAILVLLLPWFPLPYSPDELDLLHVFQPPFSWEQKQSSEPFHWLGTDGLGRDMLANILYGARTAFFISVPVMLMVSAIGTLLGAFAAFYGNIKLKISWAGVITAFIISAAFLYYGLYLPLLAINKSTLLYALISLIIFSVLTLLFVKLILPLLKRIPFLQDEIPFPADSLLLRLIELFTSIPKLVLILALASLVTPSIYILLLLLIFTYWTSTARLARAEMLKVKQLPFFEAARGVGLTNARLIFRHALPNMLAPLLVTFAFGVAGLMTLESTLSFLGIGVPGSLVSWGRVIAGIRSNTSAWWLVAVPGAFLAVTVLALQTFSYHILNNVGKRRAS